MQLWCRVLQNWIPGIPFEQIKVCSILKIRLWSYCIKLLFSKNHLYYSTFTRKKSIKVDIFQNVSNPPYLTLTKSSKSYTYTEVLISIRGKGFYLINHKWTTDQPHPSQQTTVRRQQDFTMVKHSQSLCPCFQTTHLCCIFTASLLSKAVLSFEDIKTTASFRTMIFNTACKSLHWPVIPSGM